ncbi:hypothetical protein BaRGS_00021685, partial [Batillaria attramentaria]
THKDRPNIATTLPPVTPSPVPASQQTTLRADLMLIAVSRLMAVIPTASTTTPLLRTRKYLESVSALSKSRSAKGRVSHMFYAREHDDLHCREAELIHYSFFYAGPLLSAGRTHVVCRVVTRSKTP